MFRKEALENRRMVWRGKALLLPGISPLIVAIACCGFLALFILTENYTRRINVTGEVTTWPRPVNIYSDVQGFVVERFVNEGQTTKKMPRFIKLMSVKVHVTVL
ncbi:TPA: hypothetical protein ACWOS7_004886 [Salmonella enterica subsp. enterica]